MKVSLAKLEKFLVLACDAAASPNEAHVAMQKAKAHLDEGGGSWRELLARNENGCANGEEKLHRDDRYSEAIRTRMPFGKYKGRPLGQIARIDPGYLDWLLNNLSRRQNTYLLKCVDIIIDSR